MWPAWVYIMASRRDGTTYIGVTTELPQRVFQHRTGAAPGFTRQYDCKILVWFERFDDLPSARLFGTRMKNWNRTWKLARIEERNPQWRDMYDELASHV